MKASDAVARLLAECKFSYAFELIGGMITHLVDSISMHGRTKVISMRHEQGAAFAAAGACRAGIREQFALALGTSGPGATNLITGIADCWLDNVPCLFITGQVNTYEQKGGKPIRQQGFQELEIVDLVKSITKYAVKIEDVNALLPELYKAIKLSREGRNGPVLIDIPMDLQRADIKSDQLDEILLLAKNNNIETIDKPTALQLDQLKSYVLNSKKPLILLGGGVRDCTDLDVFTSELIKLKVPYVSSLRGAEVVTQSPNYFGMIGSYGTRTANRAIQCCDLLVVLGSRLDVRQTGANVNDFARNAKKIQVDIDSGQLNNVISADLSIQTDAENILSSLVAFLSCVDLDPQWLNELQLFFNESFTNEYQDWTISPFLLFQEINRVFEKMPIQYVADVGNNQMWAAHSLTLNQHQKSHYSGGLGAMGFALPAAIGVHLSTGHPTVVVTGDGGIQLNIQELDVITRNCLPILILVLNNRSLGMVKNFQEMYFEGRDQTTYWGGYSCSFVGIAKGYGVEAYLVKNLNEFRDALESFSSSPRPLLIEVEMLEANECRPRLAFGCALDDQYPKYDVNFKCNE